MKNNNICLKCGSKKQGGGDAPICSIFLCKWCERKIIADHDYSDAKAYSRMAKLRSSISSIGFHPPIKYTIGSDELRIFVGIPPEGVTAGMWKYFMWFMEGELGNKYVGPEFVKGYGVMHEFVDRRKPVVAEEIYGEGV